MLNRIDAMKVIVSGKVRQEEINKIKRHVTYLSIYAPDIFSVDSWPEHIIRLSLQSITWMVLPKFPDRLQSFNLTSCGTNELPPLPDSIISLTIIFNDCLKELPNIPKSIISITTDILKVKGTVNYRFPDSLEELSIYDTYPDATLPKLPKNLRKLFFGEARLPLLVANGYRPFRRVSRELVKDILSEDLKVSNNICKEFMTTLEHYNSVRLVTINLADITITCLYPYSLVLIDVDRDIWLDYLERLEEIADTVRHKYLLLSMLASFMNTFPEIELE